MGNIEQQTNHGRCSKTSDSLVLSYSDPKGRVWGDEGHEITEICYR
jgi:hypothetical protein